MPHRILSADEVLEYLHIDRRELDKLVKQDAIPHSFIGERPIFRKIEIDSWASQRLLKSDERELEDFHTQSSEAKKHDQSPGHALIPELMRPDFINLELESRTKARVLRDMVALAEGTDRLIDIMGLLDGLEEREAMGSTALGGGVAMMHPPHHVPYMFEDSFICLGRTIRDLPFGSPDGLTTHLFFLICTQEDDLHLHLLARLCMMCHHTGLLLELREVTSVDEAYAALVAAEQEVIRLKLKE